MARLLVWRDSLPLILAHPFLGTGPDTYELSFPGFESLQLARHVPDHYVESPHNVFLDYLTTIGIPGALLFILLMATALGRSGSREDPVDAALFAALIGGLLAAQFIADTIPTRFGMLVVAALAFSAPAEKSKPVARRAVALAAAGGLALVLLFGGRLARADRDVLEAGRAVSRGEMEDALRQGEDARRAFPWTGTYPFVFSRALGIWVGIHPGLPLAERATLVYAAENAARASLLHSSQPQMVYVHLASLQFLEGKVKEAQESLEAAIRAAPLWYRPKWLLAVLLSTSGRSREAAEQAEAALDQGARSHPEIADNLYEIRSLASAAGQSPGRVEQGLPLFFEQAILDPWTDRPDTPTRGWAFPYPGNTLVTLPGSSLTFVVEVPEHGRFRATLRMPLAGADPSRAVVRVNQQEIFTRLLEGHKDVELNLEI